MTTTTKVLAAAIGALAAAGIATSIAVSSSPSATGAAGIVQRDGYTVTKTLTPEQVQASAAAGNDKDSGPMAAAMVGGDAAMGVKGSQAEAAVKLTDTGKKMATAFMPMIKAGVPGDTVRIEGDYLVIAGPASTFTGSGGFDLGK